MEIPLSCKVDQEIIDRLAAATKKTKINRSSLIRSLILKGLAKIEAEK